MEYEAVIGLETHVQLRTKSKMWCGCPNAFGSDPNTNVCPVCLGMPGVLPVANEKAIELTVLTGYLLNCDIPDFAKFDRKNYFYPDSAKNYQLTQYDKPSTQNGWLEFDFTGPEAQDGRARVRITRAHLEEDVGKNNHFDRHSGVDFNRAGVPLLEIVSEPDLRSPEHAYAYLRALTDVLVRGGISDCDMEKGMVRCDVNVSVRPKGSEQLGAKIEIKNMNSFSGVRRALEYEISRQIEAVKRGEKLRQETRRWDDVTGITEPMRSKEDAHDYRYFPEPDLMPSKPPEAWLKPIKAEAERIKKTLQPALKSRFVSEGLNEYTSSILAQSPTTSSYYTSVSGYAPTPELKQISANLIVNKLPPLMEQKGIGYDGLTFPPQYIPDLAKLVVDNRISMSVAQERIFPVVFETGRAPAAIVSELGLEQVSDTGAIEKLADEVIAANAGPVADYRAGKMAALNFLKGQVMKLSKGKANPALAGEILERKLKA